MWSVEQREMVRRVGHAFEAMNFFGLVDVSLQPLFGPQLEAGWAVRITLHQAGKPTSLLFQSWPAMIVLTQVSAKRARKISP
jgi:hypothetical protein